MILARANIHGGFTDVDLAARGEKNDVAQEAAAIAVSALKSVGVTDADTGALFAHMICDEIILQYKAMNNGGKVQ